MFESIISAESNSGNINVGLSLLCVLVALVLGILIAVSYVIVAKKRECSPAFVVTMVILPAITAAVILLVGSNIARAFSMAGIFALIRFRSQPGDSKDISCVFLCAAAGLASGLGYIAFAAILTLILCLAFLMVGLICNGFFRDNSKDLKILIPEDMNYESVFDEILEKYTKSYELVKVKTTNLGSMYELSYLIETGKDCNEKAFIDDIRCRNGNLNVILCKHESRKEQL